MKTWLIVIACFAAGYWVISKLLTANDSKPFRDAMRNSANEPPEGGAEVLGADDQATLANWHIILGVAKTAKVEEVRAAYKRQMSLYHPDKVASMGEEIRTVATAKAKQINAAYDLAIRYGAD